jgi:hypothetical protein
MKDEMGGDGMGAGPLSGDVHIMIMGNAQGDAEETLNTKTNKKHRDLVMSDWNLGPAVMAADNTDYWRNLARIWMMTVGEAKRQRCANCEYFDNTPESMQMMEAVPEDKYDKDGGGRGYCTKFDFICHNLRVCQAWEKKEYVYPEED